MFVFVVVEVVVFVVVVAVVVGNKEFHYFVK